MLIIGRKFGRCLQGSNFDTIFAPANNKNEAVKATALERMARSSIG